MGADDMARRFEFLSCYSDALVEFCALLENEAPTEEPESSKVVESSAKQDSEMYFVLDSMMSREEIIEAAEKEFSEDHKNTVREREDYSRRLMNVLKSNECQVKDEFEKLY